MYCHRDLSSRDQWGSNTLQQLVEGLEQRGHRVHLVRPTRKANERLRLHGGRGVPEKINPRYLGRLRHPGHLPVGAAESVTHESDDGWRETLVLGLPISSYPNLRFGLPVYRRFRRMWCKAPLDAIYIATQGPLGHGPSRPLAPTTFPR